MMEKLLDWLWPHRSGAGKTQEIDAVEEDVEEATQLFQSCKEENEEAKTENASTLMEIREMMRRQGYMKDEDEANTASG